MAKKIWNGSKDCGKRLAKISDLKFDPDNLRKHGDQNRAAIRSSLKEFGQQKAIVIDADNVVIAGNGTLQEAIDLGWTHISYTRTELVGDEARRFALADNRSGELASWDEQLLREFVGKLPTEHDRAALGFKEGDLEKMFAKPKESKTVEFSNTPKDPVRHKCPNCNAEFDCDKKTKIKEAT